MTHVREDEKEQYGPDAEEVQSEPITPESNAFVFPLLLAAVLLAVAAQIAWVKYPYFAAGDGDRTVLVQCSSYRIDGVNDLRVPAERMPVTDVVRIPISEAERTYVPVGPIPCGVVVGARVESGLTK